MRLFVALCKKRMPNGHIYRGKHRLYKEVTKDDLRNLREHLEVEEKNMFYLRHSYLTPEQSFGHARALGKREENRIKIVTTRKDYYEHVKLESRLGHLRVNEGWD
ncbi:hypothetical protein ABEB36_006445 [Hypothenemus hampei]|uniref:Ribosomal protein 63, mitochondrial n=1 Tax=Hypothenemus hampei TaxID=57062 RepID=A0ABD1ER87_HYPHA